MVAWRLYGWRADPLALGLLASLAGISAVALLQHAWADDTIAYMWWGLAGLLVYNGPNGNKSTKNETSTKAKTKQKNRSKTAA